VSLIEASHFNPAVAYAAVDRSRLDDQAPYLYRTRDYGATWQPITGGITAPAFLRAVRDDPEQKGLLFAGTEFGVYVSFDDGDQWQSLQLNLPATSVRDLAVHGDDLVIATHGRSFWILDNITPLRQTLEARRAKAAWLCRPATAVRIDNDTFVGTPLPPEEPTAENPPNGAVIDYYLPSAVSDVRLEIFDAQHNLVRRFSGDNHSANKGSVKHSSLPVAERWFPKPEVIEKTAGMHRFTWNLVWDSSGGPSADEDSEYRNPIGPKATPGTYEVRLTVDGKAQSQPLKIIMDPRSPATAEVLAQQLQLAQQIFGEVTDARRALAEITSVQKKLSDIQQRVGEHEAEQPNAKLKPVLDEAQSAIAKVLANKTPGEDGMPGLQEAYSALASALRVVESGDRAVPSQAIAVFKESSQQVKARIAEWTQFKQRVLPQLNEQLRQSNLAPVTIGGI
jgi:hypothetical protein